ncbi:Uncharacterised protein [Weeksella virosa]|uniref:Uncharacterized protein n=2 Tax=Weeksella virosa TaxID=1014 RepID=F0P0Z6_WEEVC|nr:hypothetical protein Weevi_1893 [Weeksella virosa DSM 16922]VEH63760.1 Uncharacterised protein [Weeksella virosa]
MSFYLIFREKMLNLHKFFKNHIVYEEIFFSLVRSSILSLQAQMGVNTDNPQATLDVQGNVIVGEASYTEDKTGFLLW